MDPQALVLEVENRVLTIRLERPEARNALDRTAGTIGQSLLIGTDDHHEGRQAFRERRPPEFGGR